MKTIYKNTNENLRVRVLDTDELGTVTDRILMKRNGRPQLYCQVQLDKRPGLDRWYWADQLGRTKEQCHITLAGDDGTEIRLRITFDFEDNTCRVQCRERLSDIWKRSPKSLSLGLASYLISNLQQEAKRATVKMN